MALSKAKVPREVKLFILQVENFLAQFDVAMTEPATYARGQKIAALTNELDMAKDLLKHFGIKGWPVKKVGRLADSARTEPSK